MQKFAWMLLGLWVLSGCGGYYTLTAGDHVAATGEEAPIVVRLQRNDFFVLNLAVKQAAMRFQAADGPQRAAYTDKLGYAGTTVPAPVEPGRYTLRVDHMDFEGEEVAAETALYVWPADVPLLAVEADTLPEDGDDQLQEARQALEEVTQHASVVYLTRDGPDKHEELHQQLTDAGYPDGPILLWQRQRWHIVRGGRWNWPRVVVENRLISQLLELRKRFPNLSQGICTSKLAAKAFAEAGLRAVIVGDAGSQTDQDIGRESWGELVRKGL